MWLIIPCFPSLLGFQITKFVSQRSHKELHPAQLNLVKIIVSLSMKIYSSFVRSRCEFMKFLATLVFPCVSHSTACMLCYSVCSGSRLVNTIIELLQSTLQMFLFFYQSLVLFIYNQVIIM
jgi:hypothetical protein